VRSTKQQFGENFSPFNFDENPLDKSDGSSLLSESEIDEVASDRKTRD
jgi:hypothetical protein